MKRYQRQMLLSEIGEIGQKIISNSKVLIIGAGGLGHPALQYLSAMGIGTIGLVDGDLVDESNLHRQVLFSINDLGKKKVHALQKYFSLRNEKTNIVGYDDYLTKDLAFRIFPDYDVIIDGTDNFESKFLINDVCCYFNKPLVYGSISKFEGQVSVFWRDKGPCYRCLVKDIPKSQIKSCAESGVIGALPGVIGAMQAAETLKILMTINRHDKGLAPLVGQVHIIDLGNNETLKLRLSVNPHCLCQTTIINSEMINDISVSTCAIKNDSIFIDVREPDELIEFNIPNILNWPLSRISNGDFPNQLLKSEFVTVCKSGARAQKAAEILKSNGFNKVTFTRKSIYEY